MRGETGVGANPWSQSAGTLVVARGSTFTVGFSCASAIAEARREAAPKASGRRMFRLLSDIAADSTSSAERLAGDVS
jgi:hypothetical protein